MKILNKLLKRKPGYYEDSRIFLISKGQNVSGHLKAAT